MTRYSSQFNTAVENLSIRRTIAYLQYTVTSKENQKTQILLQNMLCIQLCIQILKSNNWGGGGGGLEQILKSNNRGGGIFWWRVE